MKINGQLTKEQEMQIEKLLSQMTEETAARYQVLPKEHLELSQKSAEKSIVLLKNVNRKN